MGINKSFISPSTLNKDTYQVITTEKDEPGTKINLETEVTDKGTLIQLPELQTNRYKSTPANIFGLQKESSFHKTLKEGITQSSKNQPKTTANILTTPAEGTECVNYRI